MVDKEYSKKEIETLLKDNEYETLYLKTLQYISYQMRTISEVKKHLKKYTKKQSLITRVINELKEHGYLSDMKYVKEYVYEKTTYDNVGPNYIKEKLIQKGIHFDLIQEALTIYTEEMERLKCQELIEKELKYQFKANFQKTVLSLKQKLINKGFSLNVVNNVISENEEGISQNIDEENLLISDIIKLRRTHQQKDYQTKQKIIQKLIQKGYSYDLIKKHLD
jgi:regulatory protein